MGWCGSLSETVDVISALKNRSHEIKYWVLGDDSVINKAEFLDTIFHNHFDAIDNKSAKEVDCSKFRPLSKSFIKKLHETESVVLTMMNKHFERMNIEERKHFYYRTMQYWHGVIEQYKPDAIIFNSIPHAPYEYVVYSIAHEMGIKTVLFEPFWINDRMLVMSDYKIGSPRLGREAELVREKKINMSDISDDLQEYYRMQTDESMDATPGYLKDIKGAYSGLGWIKVKIKAFIGSIRHGIFLERMSNFIFKKFWHNLQKEYTDVEKIPDLKRKYIYFPLHYQPECATSPMGDIFVDQLLAVEILSASLPDDWMIYIKEHPAQWRLRGINYSIYRYKGYYERMARLKNTKIVPMQMDTYSLINDAEAVATITGTAGWEAILRRKPTLIFGYPWYKHAPGIFKIDSVKSCSEALKKIVGGFSISKQEVINYLFALDRGSFRAYFKYRKTILNKVSAKENTANLLNILLQELENSR